MNETTEKVKTLVELNKKYRNKVDEEVKFNKAYKKKPSNVREVVEDALRVRYF